MDRRTAAVRLALAIIAFVGIAPAVLIVCVPPHESPEFAPTTARRKVGGAKSTPTGSSSSISSTPSPQARLLGISPHLKSAEPLQLASGDSSSAESNPTGDAVVAAGANIEGPQLAAPLKGRSNPHDAPPSSSSNDVPSNRTRRILTMEATPSLSHSIAESATDQPTPTIVDNVDPLAAMRRAEQLNRAGMALAIKGSLFAARAEFTEALQLVIAAADSRGRSSARTRSLHEATAALAEARDFIVAGRRLESSGDVSRIVAGHRSRVVDPTAAAGLSSAAAQESYRAFARRKFSEAGAGEPAASVALHGLGKVSAAIGAAKTEKGIEARLHARMYYEAALDIGPDNFLATNDLAVLLAEEGSYEQARSVLQHGIRLSPQPAMWNNLAAVHDRLGEHHLAQQARQEAQAWERRAATTAGTVLPTHNVQWLDAGQFAATNRPPADTRSASAQVAPTNNAVNQDAARAPAPAVTPAPVPTTARRIQKNALTY